ncbi:MAG: hypothetical protein WDL87_06420 [Candidatus Omnitrophota bacterium]|jgi:hypothetical protein
MIILYVEFLMVVLSSWLLTREFFGIQGLSESVIICFMLGFAQVVLVELLCGITGKLYFGHVFAVHGVFFLLILILYFRKKKEVLVKPDLEPFLKSNILLYGFSVFAAFYAVKIFINLLNPPLSPDSLQFHLAFPAAWITQGNLNSPFFVFGASPIVNPGSLETGSLSYYPINAQLFYTWLMLPLRNGFLADIGEAPFYIIGILAIYAILKRYGIERTKALLLGFTWALIPNILKQLRTGSLIDVICAALLLMVFYTLLLLKKELSVKHALLFGIALGLFIGTKIINFVWLIAFIPFISYVLFSAARQNKLSFCRGLAICAAVMSMIIALGGYVYIKNYMYTGNPLFPVSVKIFGKTLFNGLLDNAGYKDQIARGDQIDIMKIIFREGLGLQFLLLILPCTVAPLMLFRYMKTRLKQPFTEYILLFLTPLLMIVLYGAFINISWVRYIFPYLTVGLVAAVIFVTALPGGSGYLNFVSCISITAAIFELAKGYELVSSILLTLLLFALLLLYKKQSADFYKSKAFVAVLAAGFSLVALVFVFLNAKYDREEFIRYPLTFSKKEAWQIDTGKSWKWLNEHTGRGVTIAYAGRSEFYPLFGSKFKNKVLYVSVNEKVITPYNDPDGFCRQRKDYAAWRRNLLSQRIDYLYTVLPCFENREVEDPSVFPIEDQWAALHPDSFQLVFSNTLTRIYKIRQKDIL